MSLLRALKGKQVLGITLGGGKRLTLTFSDGTTLVAGVGAGTLCAELQEIAQAANAIDVSLVNKP